MFITKFIEYLTLERKYSVHTIAAYRNDLISFRDFGMSTFEDFDLKTVDYGQIRNWIVVLVEEGKSNRTVNRKISSLKTFYKFLQKIEEIDKSPLVKHRVLKTDKKIQIPFSNDEVMRVLTSLSDKEDFTSCRDRLIIELFYATGMRRIELVNLKISDIDIGSQKVKVLGKRNKERIVPLLPIVCNRIDEYMPLRNQISGSHQVANLFITTKGVKIYETLVYRIINTYFSKASSKVKTSPHILRHSFATQLLNEGANLNAVKELLGHSSLAATQVYTHQNVAQLTKAYKNAHPRNKKK
ncbi:tyrosine-type recombinase/integrase [Aquimarina sp. W85]|uniref:tyrosine-type recombinase/integrase n=1 Tax=Aquimarina rhodophyticola TaxID=3342246 RepID=UPI00366FD60F